MTDQRRLAALEDQCVTVRYDRDATAVSLQLKCLAWLRDAGYPVEDVTDVQTVVSVKSDADDSGYLVERVETLSKPTEDADVVEDAYSFWACTCPDFHFRQFPDLDEESIERVGECAHVAKAKRKNRLATEADDGQETLV